jgi:hypothetical protein
MNFTLCDALREIPLLLDLWLKDEKLLPSSLKLRRTSLGKLSDLYKISSNDGDSQA